MSQLPPRSDLDRARVDLQNRLSALEPRVRRRVQGKCPDITRMSAFDLDDVMASARRRLDLALLERRIAVGSDAELISLLQRTAERIIIDIAQRERLRKRIESNTSAQFRRTAPDVEADDDAISALETLLPQFDPNDRRILELVARGTSHERIAEEIGVSLCAYRSRWRRLKTRVASWCKVRWRAG